MLETIKTFSVFQEMQLNSTCVQQKQKQFPCFWRYLEKNTGTKEENDSPNLVITLEVVRFLEELSSIFGAVFLKLEIIYI